MADSNQELVGLQKNLQNVGTNVGFLERGFLKMHKTLTNTPVVKQMVQLKRFAANLSTVWKSTEKLTAAEKKLNDEKMKNVPTLTLFVGLMTQFSTAAKLANKGTTATTMALFRLGSMLLFLGGIFTTIVLIITLFTAALGDVNSPLANMLSEIPVVGEALEGFRLILGGEGGEGGITNAVNIFAAALLTAVPLFLLFGAPVAILGATLVAAIGVFRWVKNATDSFVAGVLGAVATISAGLAVFAGYFAVFGGQITSAIGAFLGPILAGIALFVGGITLMWLSLTGEINYWWGVIGAIFTVIGAAILLGLTGFITLAAWPVVAIAAVGAAIISPSSSIGMKSKHSSLPYGIGALNLVKPYGAVLKVVGKQSLVGLALLGIGLVVSFQIQLTWSLVYGMAFGQRSVASKTQLLVGLLALAHGFTTNSWRVSIS